MRRDLIYPLILGGTILLGMVIVISTIITQPHSQGYTKVYFEKTEFPEIIPNKTYTLAFIIESHELEDMEYIYTVYINNKPIKSGKVILKPNEIYRVPFNFSISSVIYEKKIVKNEITTFYINGSMSVVGVPSGYGVPLSSFNLTAEEIMYLIKEFPLIYKAPQNTAFILNSSKNISITKIYTQKTENKIIKTFYKYNLTKTNGGYILTTALLQTEYYPTPVEIYVIVSSNKGKEYPLKTLLKIRGG